MNKNDKFKLMLSDYGIEEHLHDNIITIINHSKCLDGNIGMFDNLLKFWIYLLFWFTKKGIIEMLGISIVTFYNLDNYIRSHDYKVKISEKLINKLEILRKAFGWYFNEN